MDDFKEYFLREHVIKYYFENLGSEYDDKNYREIFFEFCKKYLPVKLPLYWKNFSSILFDDTYKYFSFINKISISISYAKRCMEILSKEEIEKLPDDSQIMLLNALEKAEEVICSMVSCLASKANSNTKYSYKRNLDFELRCLLKCGLSQATQAELRKIYKKGVDEVFCLYNKGELFDKDPNEFNLDSYLPLSNYLFGPEFAQEEAEKVQKNAICNFLANAILARFNLSHLANKLLLRFGADHDDYQAMKDFAEEHKQEKQLSSIIKLRSLLFNEFEKRAKIFVRNEQMLLDFQDAERRLVKMVRDWQEIPITPKVILYLLLNSWNHYFSNIIGRKHEETDESFITSVVDYLESHNVSKEIKPYFRDTWLSLKLFVWETLFLPNLFIEIFANRYNPYLGILSALLNYLTDINKFTFTETAQREKFHETLGKYLYLRAEIFRRISFSSYKSDAKLREFLIFELNIYKEFKGTSTRNAPSLVFFAQLWANYFNKAWPEIAHSYRFSGRFGYENPIKRDRVVLYNEFILDQLLVKNIWEEISSNKGREQLTLIAKEIDSDNNLLILERISDDMQYI